MRYILITGANRGIGLEMVRQYLDQEDVLVFAMCRQPTKAEALNNLIQTHPNRLIVIPLDVVDAESLARSVEVVRAKSERIDVLVNNAGIGAPDQTLEKISSETMHRLFDVNAVAPLMVAKAYLPLLRAGDNPRLVNISSQVGSMEWKKSGGSYAYAASKAALNMVTRCLAADLRADGVVTVTLHPGWVQTDMGGASASLTVEESARGILGVIQNLTSADNGHFFKWNGDTHPW